MSTPAKPFGASDSLRSPYAPKRSRPTASDSPQGALDDPPPPRFLVASRDGEREDLTDFTESSLQFRDSPHSPLSESTPRRSLFSERRSYSGSEHARGDATDDIDLQRLEESVRRLQREAAVSRTRPAADEQAGGQTADARVPRRRDTYIDGYRVPPSLQPEVLTPPAELREGRGRLWTVMSMLLASAVAAPIAYYFAAGSSSDSRVASAESRPTVETLTVTAPAVPARPARSQERVDVAAVPEAPPVTVVPRRTAPAPEPQRAAPPAPPPPAQRVTPPAQTAERTPPAQTAERTPPAQVERTPPPAQRVTPPPPPAQVERTPPPAQRVTPPPPAQAERTPPPAPRITPPPAQPPAQNVERAPPPPPVQSAAPASAPTRTLDAGEIDVLVKQGQQFVAAGDFVTARLVFQRAAEAGNAAAALALGASYDPVVLSRLGVRGVDADVAKARAWYQKAKDFGAPDADRRLSTLANR
jgi:hypothetical protein